MSVNPVLTAICGGIGSGKSVVAKILRSLGYPVYDCDLRAKEIMDGDIQIHKRLCDEIHPLSVVDGIIDRKLISKIVFNDPKSLQRLDNIVHQAVIKDIEAWMVNVINEEGCPRLFVETAILVKSGLFAVVDEIWEVTAPLDVRIERVKQRSGLSEEQVRLRIESQTGESLGDIPHKTIVNSPETAILPQIHELLG